MIFKAAWLRVTVASALAVALLASCGGGTQIEAFAPRRVVVFGDESSLLVPDTAVPSQGQGRKYTINSAAYDASVPPVLVFNCAANQIWVQQLAYSYGFSFPECATVGYNANSLMRAQVGADAASLASQVSSFLSADRFAENDLVTVMVGENDILAAFNSRATIDPVLAARQAGVAVGAQVVRITDLGAKVLVATVPDVSLTPYALSLDAASIDLLHTLSAEFNTQLRLKLEDVANGGRSVGLLLVNELVQDMVNVPANYALVNTSQSACNTSPALTACDSTTLAPTYSSDWLWSDDRHLGITAHSRMGSLAVSRARNNPF